MERSVPTRASEEIDLYIRTIYSLLRSTTPVRIRTLEEVHAAVRALPRHLLVPAEELAKRAGSSRSSNMVMVGAASGYLPCEADILRSVIGDMFAAKGEKISAANLDSFEAGRSAGGGR